MGGGDLNLKKSWHPSTLRNIERVWKAEQKHEQEQKKIEQLQRELAEERAREEMRQFAENHGVVKRKEERLDWMYQGPSALVDKEQYLMGRAIDKTFEIMQQHEEGKQLLDEERQPGAIFSQSSVSVTVDLAAKVREDPLFTIKKHEVEQKKRLLDNPIKMKQIQQMLEKSMSKKDKKKKKKHKKKHSESSDESEITNHRSVNKKEHSRKHKDDGVRRKSEKHSHKHHRSRKESPREPEVRYKKENQHDRSTNRHWSDQRKQPDSRSRSPKKRKLTEEEMERRRREMLENATWREEQRESNVKRYREEDEKDKQQDGEAANFIRPLLSNAAMKGSVEGRIKQKIYNIQRSKFDMDKNFAKR